jgi:diadenosine tetraphosphate (Ap4A) HIT family hydrolase
MDICPFCNLDSSQIILSNTYAVVINDGFPISPGHSLIIPKRHIQSFFEATNEEHAAFLELLVKARELLHQKYKPDAFNIGINDGFAAGQTIMHLHIHLIPRYKGDMPDPRGGVRLIFPEKADYWSMKKK